MNSLNLINCTDLFPDAEWASAHIHGSDVIRVNVQQHQRIVLLHMRISKLADFASAIEAAQATSTHAPTAPELQSPQAQSDTHSP